jgi:hypothetical protein
VPRIDVLWALVRIAEVNVFFQSHTIQGGKEVGANGFCSLVGRLAAGDVLGRSPAPRGMGGVTTTKDTVPYFLAAF